MQKSLDNFKLRNQLLGLFGDMVDPAGYIDRIWNPTYEWQREALNPIHRRLMLNCARQSGKSTIVAGLGLHTAKHKAKSLTLIFSPTEDQSKETIKKVQDYMDLDDSLQKLTRGGESKKAKEFRNGSRIIALSGSEKAARGYSSPDLIILDEAARVPEETYRAVRPMLVKNPHAQMILLSTPWRKGGFFFEEWTKNPIWKKIYVVPKWKLDDETGRIIERPPIDEFKVEMAQKGIDAFYSPHHTLEFLYEELMSIGPIWFKREYGCEFIEGMETMFSLDLIESAYDDSIQTKYDSNDEYEDDIHTFDFMEGGIF